MKQATMSLIFCIIMQRFRLGIVGQATNNNKGEPGICEIFHCGLLEDIDLTQTTIEK